MISYRLLCIIQFLTTILLFITILLLEMFNKNILLCILATLLGIFYSFQLGTLIIKLSKGHLQ